MIVKGFTGKIIFGIISNTVLLGAAGYMMSIEQSQGTFTGIFFTLAFAAGITIWLALNFRESNRRKKENVRRKNK